MCFRIIIPRVDIVQSRLIVVVIPTVADGVEVGNIAGTGDFLAGCVFDGDDFAPCVVVIGADQVIVGIDRNHVAAPVADVGIEGYG